MTEVLTLTKKNTSPEDFDFVMQVFHAQAMSQKETKTPGQSPVKPPPVVPEKVEK